MEITKLFRKSSTDEGVFGIFQSDNFYCRTLEPPWRDNASNYSCIPKGEYVVQPHYSPKFRNCFILLNVPSRSFILIHGGNYAGDYKKGLKRHSHGCLLVGANEAILAGQKAITASRVTLARMRALFLEPFLLNIIEEN